MEQVFTKILLNLKIDFSKTIIERLGGGSLGTNTELTPKDFIRFSKQDFAAKDKKGLINSLTNAKRAIDCQIDNALEEFGIMPDKIEKASESLINELKLSQKDLPFKLKLIQALGLSPGNLTAKVRNLRNKLEHYYKIPNDVEVEEAIEIAELFILSIESKTKILDDEFVISSSNFQHVDTLKDLKIKKYDRLNPKHFETQIHINYISYHKKIEITPLKELKSLKKIYLTAKEPLYYYLIRLINHLDEQVECEDDLKILLKYCEHPIPSKNIVLAEYY